MAMENDFDELKKCPDGMTFQNIWLPAGLLDCKSKNIKSYTAARVSKEGAGNEAYTIHLPIGTFQSLEKSRT